MALDASTTDDITADKSRQGLMNKPQWLNKWEQWLGQQCRWHPNWLSSLKLFVVTPALVLTFRQVDILPHSQSLVIGIFLVFSLLDYMDGVIAREQQLESKFGRIFDRATDYPLLLIISWQVIGVIPLYLIVAKVAVDTLLFIQYIFRQGTTENRIRTTISYTALLAMLVLSQGWGGAWLKTEMVVWLLYLNIAFSVIVILYNLNILQKRYIADLISSANLACGIGSIYFSFHGRLEMSLLMLLIGGLFDGLDGAAARKWGGTRWGVYSDDVADGVNYGIAPGFALYFVLGGLSGLAVGLFYSGFTLSRLVYFTLNKANADPDYFNGVPSTAGGLMVLCALILFSDQPELVGLIVGIASIQMVSFSAHYKHLGRAFASGKKRYRFGLPVYSLGLILGAFFWGSDISVALLFVLILAYGFIPTYLHFRSVMQPDYTDGSEADSKKPC